MKISKFLNRPLLNSSTKSREAGMTLIEIIIVIALIGTLMALLVKNFGDTQDKAMIDQEKIHLAQINESLQMYRVHNHKYPTTAEGLNALIAAPADAKGWRGPYTEEEKLQDVWKNKVDYESDGRAVKLISPGPDGQSGNEDDITYPESAGAAKAGEPKN